MAQVKADYRKAAVDPKTRAMLEHGEQITGDASKIAQEDVGRLRAVGLSDEEILTGTLIAGFFNHQDRVADALGVALDDAFARRG